MERLDRFPQRNNHRVHGKTDRPDGAERTHFQDLGFEDERGYLDKYPIRESIEDETMVPIKHMTAPRTMTVRVERLDSEFFALAETAGVQTSRDSPRHDR